MERIYKKLDIRFVGACLVVVALFLAASTSTFGARPVEVGYVAFSPQGQMGGGIIPASCSSGVFDSTDAVSCTRSNACGQSNTGTVTDCSGTCSVSAPANPANYGNACSNSCGQTGTIGCSGTCSVTNATCSPPTVTICQGTSCGTPRPVIVGSMVTVTWSCPSPNTSASGATTGNAFSTGGSVSGSANITITQTSTFTVVCNQTGSQASVTATAINPTVSLVASPSRVHTGNTSTLSWYASSVTSCTLSGPNTTDGPVTATNGAIASQGSPRQKTTAAITGQSTYTLSCQTDGGPVSTSVTVGLVPIQIEI